MAAKWVAYAILLICSFWLNKIGANFFETVGVMVLMVIHARVAQ